MRRKFVYNGIMILFVTLLTQIVHGQEKMVSGTVTDQHDLPLPGVTVINASSGTTTDFDGKYRIKAKVGDKLKFSYIGYRTEVIPVKNSQGIYSIKMAEDQQEMDEVIVIAYGTSDRESITGSISTVSSKDIEKRPVSNVLSSLEGSAPGIQFNSNSGQPGSAGSIRIRGFTTLNGSNSPLYVLDGVPFEGNISDLNPQDIKSISVLKDASSTALYGNRASNGVIIIKTKEGSANSGSSLSVSVKQGVFERGIPEYDRIGPDRFMETMWAGYRNSLMTDNASLSFADANQTASNTLVDTYLKANIYNVQKDNLFTSDGQLNPNAEILAGYLNDLDWFEGIERRGNRQEVSVSARTSNEKGGVYYSLGYLDEEGYVKTSSFNRLTARVNANYRATEWLKTGLNLSGTHQKQNNVNSSSSGSYKNPFNYSRSIAPIYPVHLHDQVTGAYVLDDVGQKIYDGGDETRNQYVGRHVIWENELDKTQTHRNTLQGMAYADFDFLKDFTFTIRGELNLRNSEEQSYNNAIIGDGAGNDGRSKKVIYRYKNYTSQQLLNWKRSFNNHNFEALLGHESFSNMYDYTYGYKTNETFPGQSDFVNFNQTTNLDGYQTEYTTEGYLSRVKYNYARKYYLEGSFRRDGSSKFANDKRWGNFWSIGGNWIITKEEFFDYNFVNTLKLRASYGEVGNDTGAGRHAYQSLYTIDQNANLAALYINQAGATDLIWETSSQFGAGVEGRLFNRANFTLEYFDKRSQNLLFDVNLPLSSGATSTGSAEATITKNIGVISNKGIEFGFDVDVINTKEWRWNIGANATWMKNKILRLPEENRENGLVSGTKKRIEGRGIYDFWTYQFVGVDQMTGNSLYEVDVEKYNVNGSNPDADIVPEEDLVNINGDYYTLNTTYGRKDWSGSAIPDVYGSFTTSLSWNNFTLSGLVTYSLGGKVYEHSYKSLMSMSGSPSSLHADILKAWSGVPEGMTENSADRIDPNGIPIVDFSRSSNNNKTGNRWLMDGSYLNIKNITLNYSLPKDLMKKLNIKNMDINFGVENLMNFTSLKGMNPQFSYSGSSDNEFVPYRIYSVGLNIGI